MGPNGYSASESTATLDNVSLIDSGDYHVEITFDGLDCLLDTFATVVVHPSPVITLIDMQNSLCFGSDDGYIVTDLVGGEPLDILWSNTSVFDSIGGLSPGQYILNVEDAFTCITIDTFNITAVSYTHLTLPTTPYV